MNKLFITSFFGLALIMTAMGSHAMEPATDKKFTLDISSPGVGTAYPMIGGRMFLSSDTAIEGNGNLQIDGKDTDAGIPGGTQMIVSGGIMKYLSKGRVSPYMRAGGVVALYFGDRYNNKDNDLQGYAGVGAEFMITEELSIRASVNGVLAISPFKIATGTSELSLSFFF